MINNPLPRLDRNPELRERLLQFCRLKAGAVWEDSIRGHRIGCLDAADSADVLKLCGDRKAQLAIHDPPYNLVAFDQRPAPEFIAWCKQWVLHTRTVLLPNSGFYVWLGADQDNGFQPLPEFMLMMRETPFRSRSFITMRNQRGFGTQHNWMCIRQELLYYVLGKPAFAPGMCGLTFNRYSTAWTRT
jgi:site-specific DNA-methyltransferase (adenine-specific)